MSGVMRATFKKTNTIPYGQDMQFFRGIPTHIKFTFCPYNKERIILKAPNYGGDPYGNGYIYVSVKDLPEELQVAVKREKIV